MTDVSSGERGEDSWVTCPDLPDFKEGEAKEGDLSGTFFILDETGDTTVDCGLRLRNPETEEASGGESESEEEEGEIKSPSSSSSSGMSPRRAVRKSAIGQGTPGSGRRRGSKRKRRQTLTTPMIPKKTRPENATKKKNRKKKKSVIVINDSDDERCSPGIPDLSVVEIDDDSQSVIVLSDDEVGVCSGSVTKSPTNAASHQPLKHSNRPNGYAKPLASPTKKGQTSPTKPNTNDSSEKCATKEKPLQSDLLYQPLVDPNKKRTGLRPIVIDGSNVAFGHGLDRFSSLGLKICIDFFKQRGHEVKAFVPLFRKTHPATMDPQILHALEKDRTLIYTPSRRTDGRLIVPYDDRYVVEYAHANGGVIVSRDNYHDLINENPDWKETITKRTLQFTWAGDGLMLPKDPLGQGGPTLQEFLKF